MAKYRKKPVVVEAFRYGIDEVPLWAREAKYKDLFKPFSQYGGPNGTIRWCEIETLEGTMRGDYGDYIIKGIKGEIYPCKPDIFEQTYEPVE